MLEIRFVAGVAGVQSTEGTSCPVLVPTLTRQAPVLSTYIKSILVVFMVGLWSLNSQSLIEMIYLIRR